MRDMLALHGTPFFPDGRGRAVRPEREHPAERRGQAVGVRAGLKGGARVVAVATGSDSEEDLRAEGADIVLADLRDTRAVVEAVTGLVG